MVFDSSLLVFVALYWDVLYLTYFSGSDKIPVLPDDLSHEIMVSAIENGITKREDLKMIGVRNSTLKQFYRDERNKAGKSKILTNRQLETAERNKTALAKFEESCRQSVQDYYFNHNSRLSP
jgi:hypothetical protein